MQIAVFDRVCCRAIEWCREAGDRLSGEGLGVEATSIYATLDL
ncbi:hypothetical protein [Chamaesiphon sp. VAR_69_metabat_338]|nr:hypothetical protein [Chamaesiphon sp. VAR_69_metabat_338]